MIQADWPQEETMGSMVLHRRDSPYNGNSYIALVTRIDGLHVATVISDAGHDIPLRVLQEAREALLPAHADIDVRITEDINFSMVSLQQVHDYTEPVEGPGYWSEVPSPGEIGAF